MSLPRADRPCVRCGKPQTAPHAPFCSAGCRDRDLLDWLDERHVLPADAALDNSVVDD
jgi:endogenous inhibitor of DNA gyrase (YacG/DUF329 family)